MPIEYKNIEKRLREEKMRLLIKVISVILLLASIVLTSCTQKEPPHKDKKNVLFIVVDDLRPELGCYGDENIMSPNIDKLAADGYKFTNAYCQVPVCGASRSSFLSGLRPTRTRFVDFGAWVQKDAPDAETLPMYFKKNGYTTISNGKVFHHKTDSQDSWSEKPWAPDVNWRDYLNAENKKTASENKEKIKKYIAASYESADVDDYAYIDGKVAKKSIADLKRLKESGKPFFLAVGFRKPHLPYNHPKKYWDMYEDRTIPPADNPFVPKNAPKVSIHNSYELRVYTDIPEKGKIPDEKAKELKRAYYACVTYVDKLIGEVLEEVKTLGLEDDTVVLLIGDHGYQLGEHTMWCKHCNYKTSLNAPLIIKAPGLKKNVTINELSEFVDIYPTLCDLARIPEPQHLAGRSLVPLLKGDNKDWKNAVYSRFHDGESVKTERYLYTEYVDDNGKVYARMLYDHSVDPEENENIAEQQENREVVAELSALLKNMRTGEGEK